MSKLMVVAAREVAARKLLFPAALIMGFFPLAIGAISRAHAPGIPGATMMALIFGIVIAVVIGASVVGRELGERRLSFYFARPLSGTAIWGGKVLGGLAAVLASEILVLAPSLVVNHGLPTYADGGIFVSVIVAMSVALLSFGIVLGIVLRAKTAWIGLDLGVLIGSGLLAGSGWRILSAGIYPTAETTWTSFLVTLALVTTAVVAITLFVAGAAAVIIGRCDLRRAHRAASLVLLALIPLGASGVAWAHWFVTPSGSDLSARLVKASPDGHWALITGEARGRSLFQFTRFVDLSTLRAVDPGDNLPLQPAFSADGRTAAWVAQRRLLTLALDRRGAEPVRSRSLAFARNGVEIYLSPAGDRILIIEPQTVSLYSLPDEHPLAVVPSESMSVQAARFVTPTRVRLYRQSTPSQIRIDELDLGTKRMQKTGELELASFRRLSPAGDRIVGNGVLSDGRTGGRLASLPDAAIESFLADGRVVVISADGLLRVLTRDGEQERSIALGVTPWVIASQPSDHEVVITSSDRTARIVDLLAGSVRQVPAGLWPESVAQQMLGSRAGRLFTNAQGDLVEYDGSVHTLIQARP